MHVIDASRMTKESLSDGSKTQIPEMTGLVYDVPIVL
jgi:hypothetical protein